MSCTVCAEAFNQHVHKKIICPHCHYEAGRSCIERYFHTLVNDYQCMNCHKIWDDEFIKTEMTQASVNRLKKHREEVLYDREKSFMPETQIYVIRANFEDKRNELRQALSKVSNMLYWTKKSKKEMEHHNDICYQLQTVITEAEKLKEDLSGKLKELQENAPQIRSQETNKKQGFKSDIVLPCPVDKCRGYVSSKWNCGICDTNICHKCHEPKNDNHECTQANLESAKLVRETTKPCPKCAIRIHRISGCTQMWCTQCCTSFDYRTGEIYTRNIHNPHYFEWLRRNPIQTNQVNQIAECGDGLTLNQLITMIRRADYLQQNDMLRYGRHHWHLLHIMNENGYNPPRTPFDQNLSMRIAWMQNKLSDNEFKQRLQQREKKINVTIRKRQILEMCTQVTRELCFRLYTGIRERNIDWNAIKTEFDSIVNYTDECLSKMQKIYKYQMPNVRL